VNKRAALIVTAALLVLAPATAQSAYADTGPNPVSCSSGSTCVVQLENEVSFSGNYSRGTDNGGVTVPPPPCEWIPLGNSSTGSEQIINELNQADSINGSLTAQEQALLAEATKLAAEKPPPPGEWYGGIPTSDSDPDGCGSPNIVFVPPAAGGVINPPPVPLPPVTLAALAIKVMKLPTVGTMVTSPAHGKTYSDMPTFVRVTMTGQYEKSAGGMPYLMVSATLDGKGATAWAYATPLTLNTTATDPTRWGSCGYLGSVLLAKDPGKVANVGAGGSADCGFTFHLPQAATITAALAWKTCWVDHAIQAYQPPAAGCAPVPNAALNGINWNAAINIEEIQAGNG
jgi:hypothetical protein